MKVSRKVGRRSRSSVSRRRFRNNKNKKSGYKKRYGKTQRRGARSRKYGHKRGKRFHRGGVGTSLGSILLEYKKNDGKLLTTFDKKMFSTDFHQKADELNLKRCSGNTSESCKIPSTPNLSFFLNRLQVSKNMEMSKPFVKTFLEEFVNSNQPLVLEGKDNFNNPLGVTYTFPASTLNKQSFKLLLQQVNNPPPHIETQREKLQIHSLQHYQDELDAAEQLLNQNPDNDLAQAEYELALATLIYNNASTAMEADTSDVEANLAMVEAKQQVMNTAKDKVEKLRQNPPTIFSSHKEKLKHYAEDPTMMPKTQL